MAWVPDVQAAVDTKNHLIVAHEVTNVGTDRHQLSNMAEQARTEMGVETLDAVADRGYYASEEIRASEEAGIAVTLPKPMTSNAKAAGRFGKQDFRYVAAEDVYICPAGQKLTYFFTTADKGLVLRRYRTNAPAVRSMRDAYTSFFTQAGPTAEVRRFTQSLREPAATVAPYYRVGLAVRSCVVNFRTRSTLALFEYFQRPVGVHGHYQLAADHLEHGQVGIDHERYAPQRHHRNPPPDPELACDHLIAVRQQWIAQ